MLSVRMLVSAGAALVATAALAAPKVVGPSNAAAKPMVLTMQQVTVKIDPDGDAKTNADKIAAFQTATLGIFSCDDVEGVAQGAGATVQANTLALSDLPPALQSTVKTMKVGTATQLFGNRESGTVSVLVLCARR